MASIIPTVSALLNSETRWTYSAATRYCIKPSTGKVDSLTRAVQADSHVLVALGLLAVRPPSLYGRHAGSEAIWRWTRLEGAYVDEGPHLHVLAKRGVGLGRVGEMRPGWAGVA